MRLVALALCMTACNVGLIIQHDRNAPPPVDIRSPAPEQPTPDPDLQFAYGSTRALLGGGFTTGGVRTEGSSYLGAIEGHLIYGRDRVSPNLNDGSRFPVLAVPDDWVVKRGIGLNLGWAPILDDDRPSRLYVEAELIRFPFTLGAGWAWEPNGPGKGPQATVWLGALFARSSFLNAGGTSVQFGAELTSLWLAHSWSR